MNTNFEQPTEEKNKIKYEKFNERTRHSNDKNDKKLWFVFWPSPARNSYNGKIIIIVHSNIQIVLDPGILHKIK